MNSPAIVVLFVTVLAVLVFAACAGTDIPSVLQTSDEVLSAERFEPEPYEALGFSMRRHMAIEDYEACVSNSRSIHDDFYRIRYRSDGLEVTGLVSLPAEFSGDERVPVIVMAHGNAGEGGRLTACKLRLLHGFVRAGYAVFAPQYRGVAGGEGADEYGGAEVNDILSLLDIARSFDFADSANVYLFGVSRGGMMTFLALRHGAQVNAAAVMCGLADMVALTEQDPNFQGVPDIYFPDVSARPALYRERSATLWPEYLTTPLLMLHGDADDTAPVEHVRHLSSLLDDLDQEHRLIVYPGATHCLSGVDEWRNEILGWFEAHRAQ